jgi:hypothetical protein
MRLRPLSEVVTDRRRSPRTQAICLQLAYWDGSQGVLKRIREVSSHGAFVETQSQWCADTVMQTQLIAELPLPALSEGVAQGVSTPENVATESSGNHNVLQTKSARPTETMSIALTCRVVRLVHEGICVDFMHRSEKERLAVESFLITVKERTRTGEANASEAIAPQPIKETVVPEDPKDCVWRFAERPVKQHPALQIVHQLWGTVIGECARIQRFHWAANDQRVAIPSIPLVSLAAQPAETSSDSVAVAPPIPIEPNEIAPSNVQGPHGTRVAIKWAWLIAVAILTLANAWMLRRAVSGPARIPLGLQVVSRGKQLEIHWNHDATPIRNAAKGVMRISDGGVQEVIEFDATQLRDGAVAYSPTSNDVTVRFEVNSVDGTTSSASMRSVAIP